LTFPAFEQKGKMIHKKSAYQSGSSGAANLTISNVKNFSYKILNRFV